MASVVAGCGSDGPGEALEEPTDYATCDSRVIDSTCLEIQAPKRVLVQEESHCPASAWMHGALSCPDDSTLIGCCAYEANHNRYRDCSYAGHEGDPKAQCESEVHGYWQPPGF